MGGPEAWVVEGMGSRGRAEGDRRQGEEVGCILFNYTILWLLFLCGG